MISVIGELFICSKISKLLVTQRKLHAIAKLKKSMDFENGFRERETTFPTPTISFLCVRSSLSPFSLLTSK